MGKSSIKSNKDEVIIFVSVVTASFLWPFILQAYIPFADGILTTDAEFEAWPYLVQLLWFLPNVVILVIPILITIAFEVGTYKALSSIFVKEVER